MCTMLAAIHAEIRAYLIIFAPDLAIKYSKQRKKKQRIIFLCFLIFEYFKLQPTPMQ